MDDIGIHEMRNSLFTYFNTAYNNPGNILKTIYPAIQNPENITIMEELLNATSKLFASQFDEFLKRFK